MAMGTTVTVTVALESERQRAKAAAVITEIEQAMTEFGRRWWAWGNGELSRINQQLAAGNVVEIPVDMRPLFARAWQMRQRTGGRFEPRIAALVRLWGFDDVARLRSAPPVPAEIAALLSAMNAAPPYEDGQPYGPAPAVSWDFGGIAKGDIVDVALDLLRERGFGDATVDAGGNLSVRGRRHDRPWQIGIRDPRSDAEEPTLLATLAAQDEAVNTHGDDQRYFEYEGRRYAHILDPLSGMPVQGLRSLTVVHPDGTLAEAGGAALFVAGPEGWPALAAQLGIDQVMAVADDGRIVATPKLAARLQPMPGVRIDVVGSRAD